ncbi:alpha/beta fold hydrolase [Streptomyces sp. NEAU-S77]|uniref:alpha/beta fold hydrolase n=1 Tax=Streptomyces sp. NEAU-S77 TaxID=3411033 RepID=UPI003B9E1DFE
MTAHAPRQAHVTSTDGTKIAVTITGQGRPLVVSPGALNAAQDWQVLADLLAPRFATYAIDRRGRGASGDNGEHTIQREADDIAAVLGLAGPDAILLGHSYGGLVTLAHALHQPPRLSSSTSPRSRWAALSAATPSLPSRRPSRPATSTEPSPSGCGTSCGFPRKPSRSSVRPRSGPSARP